MTDSSSSPEEKFISDVERLRRKRGMSTHELAARSGLSLAEVEAVLGREGGLPLDVIVLLARALEVSPGSLIDGTAEQEADD